MRALKTIVLANHKGGWMLFVPADARAMRAAYRQRSQTCACPLRHCPPPLKRWRNTSECLPRLERLTDKGERLMTEEMVLLELMSQLVEDYEGETYSIE